MDIHIVRASETSSGENYRLFSSKGTAKKIKQILTDFAECHVITQDQRDQYLIEILDGKMITIDPQNEMNSIGFGPNLEELKNAIHKIEREAYGLD